jgi:general secretion pathway protein A
MYARHFDLKQDPFSIAPDPRFLFMSERHREALAHLLFGVTGTGGFVLFTGDIGTGKTTVCRCFLEQIPDACHVAIVFNPKLSVMELLQNICEEFHVSVDKSGGNISLKSYVDALNVFLLQSHAAGQSNVLIIDEAQNLLPEVLEQLRLLTNLETHERKLLQIVLIGQPELRTMLERPDLEQLAQRVIARYHLESLNLADTARYIQHRLTVAGHTGRLPFDEKALRRIFSLTRGVPRRINLLCGRSLLGAWANGLHQVDRSMIDKAATEVFGTKPKPEVGHGHTYAAAVLGALGAMALSLAAALHFWPNAVATEFLADRAAPAKSAVPAVPSVPAEPAEPAVAVPPERAASSPEPTAVPSAAASAPGPVQSKPQDLESVLPQLARDMGPAWHELGYAWKFDSGNEDPCAAAVLRRLQCYRTTELTIPLLKQLDRPGILTLQKGDEPPVYAVLIGLNDQVAKLQAVDTVYRVTLISLARFWRGEFATYWQPPQGYQPDVREGTKSAVLGLLSSQLAVLEGKPARLGASEAATLNDTLVARVKAFQKGQGIRADGHPGPMTFMQIEKALGSSGPSLEAGSL